MAAEHLKAPFPYFGGKSTVAAEVWRRFGDVDNFVEPFFGSGAVLLKAPWPSSRCETVNDLDGLVSNFWRAVAAAPDEVAYHADWPVNENDLHARHAWLVGQKDSLQARLEGDPDFYDAKIAGWWCWGMCCWIGSGFCSGNGPWQVVDRQLVHLGDLGRGVNRKLVHLGDLGRGVNRKLVHLGNLGQGVNRPLVHLGNLGRGVNRKLVHLGNLGQGVNRKRVILGSAYSPGKGVNSGKDANGGIYDWMAALSARLRRVRVCCGDWSRVCGPTPTVKQGLTGVFLDPPYSAEAGRNETLYRKEDLSVAHAVCKWAIGWQDDPRMRIALCGYDGEHTMPESWTAYRWKAHGGYSGQGGDDAPGRANSEREVIWFSPHCLAERQGRLAL